MALRSDEETNAELERLLEQYSSVLREGIEQHCPRNLGLQIGDIEQEARLRLWKSVQRAKKLNSPASYIHRIAVTTTIDAVRRVVARREEQLQPVDDSGEPAMHLVADPIQEPDSVTERRELMMAIKAAVELLPDNRRKAVELHLHGLDLAEIAELLQWSESKARSLVYRGLEDVREILRRKGIDYR